MRQRGFSLIQLAIAMTVIAIIGSAMLPGGQGGSVMGKSISTVDKMVAIERALTGWRAANSSYPCPAEGALAVSDASFGKSKGTAGTCGGGDFGPSGNAVAGVVPVRTLGLPDDYMLDNWGRRITYVVDKRATAAASSNIILSPTSTITNANIDTSVCPNVRITLPSNSPVTLAVGNSIYVSGASALGGQPSLNGTFSITSLASQQQFVVSKIGGSFACAGSYSNVYTGATMVKNPKGTLESITVIGETQDKIFRITEHGLTVGQTFTVSGVTGFIGSSVPASDFNKTHTVSFVSGDTIYVWGSVGGADFDETVYQADPRIASATTSLMTGGGGSSGCSGLSGNFGINLSKADGTTTKVVLALISHGPNGHGAFNAVGSSSRINAGTTSVDELNNASVNAAHVTNFDSNFVARQMSSDFDDIVRATTSCP